MNVEKNRSNHEHWERIYSTKPEKEVSWFQFYPTISMKFIDSFDLPKEAAIIDIGTGDSYFIDALLEKGYRNITALDISSKAIDRAKTRLGEKASGINWIVSEITKFESSTKFDLWHDRATFHFLTTGQDINRYISIAENAVKPTGFMLISTFSEQGPKKCSGLDTRQYSEKSLFEKFETGFEKLTSLLEDHTTPFNTVQNFLYCSFKKK